MQKRKTNLLIHAKMDVDYLLYRDKTGVNYESNNFGSGQLACLALQLRRC